MYDYAGDRYDDYSAGLFPDGDDDPKFRKTFLKLLISILMILLFMWLYIDHIRPVVNKTIETTNSESANIPEVKKWKDEYDRQVAKTRAISDDALLRFADYDSTIKRLQIDIQRYKKELNNKGNVTLALVETKASGKSKTDSVIYNKETPCDSTPAYFDKIDQFGSWITGEIIARKDTTLIYNLSVKHTFSVVNGYEKNGWFKKPTPFCILTSDNPYDSIVDLKTYNVEDKRKRNILRPFGVGVTIGAIGVLLLIK